MGTGYWLRAGILILSFAVVVMTMYSVQHHGLGPNVSAVLTGERTAKVLPKRVDLCETRVKSLKTSHGVELFERAMTWTKKDAGKETKLDPVEVEKWLGHNCSPTVENLRPVASKEIQAAAPVLILDFIQGAPETIRQTTSGDYIWKQISFHSTQLESAIKELTNIREAGPKGRARPSED